MTPRVFLHLHHHRGATRTNLLNTEGIKTVEYSVYFARRMPGYSHDVVLDGVCERQTWEVYMIGRHERYA